MKRRPKVASGIGLDRLTAATTPTLERYAAALERRIQAHHADLHQLSAYVHVQRVLHGRPGRRRS